MEVVPLKSKLTCIAILLVAAFLVPAASADESYKFNLGKGYKIGSSELQAGDYRLVVGGPKLVLTEVKTGKTVEFAAKVENSDKKFGSTEVHSKKVDGVNQISEIRIGGSKTKVVME